LYFFTSLPRKKRIEPRRGWATPGHEGHEGKKEKNYGEGEEIGTADKNEENKKIEEIFNRR
jgi:hypothetical protein